MNIRVISAVVVLMMAGAVYRAAETDRKHINLPRPAGFVSVQVHCSDLGLYETFNKVYVGYLHREYPARAFLGAGKLLRGATFEVTGTAVKRTK